MKILTQNKGMLLIVVLFVAAMFLYKLLPKSETLVTPSESSAFSVGDDLLKIRQELEAVTLDKTIFSSSGYLHLTDFSAAISPQTTGRSNPFDIIGRD